MSGFVREICRRYEFQQTLQRLASLARAKDTNPIVEELRKWLDDIAPSVLPKSLFGLAVNYGRQQWKKLVQFLEDGRIEISNNAAERSIKPLVVGRKNDGTAGAGGREGFGGGRKRGW